MRHCVRLWCYMERVQLKKSNLALQSDCPAETECNIRGILTAQRADYWPQLPTLDSDAQGRFSSSWHIQQVSIRVEDAYQASATGGRCS